MQSPKFLSILRFRKVEPDSAAQAQPAPATETALPRLVPSKSIASTPELQISEPEDRGTASWLHELQKNTDFWFDLKIDALEKYAIAEAESHAERGLPHQEAQSENESEAEKYLRVQSTALFSDWESRVRTKVQDGIHSASAEVTDGLVDLAHALAELDVHNQTISGVMDELKQEEEAVAGKQRTFGFGRLLGMGFYVPIISLLVLGDWVANVPVFGELLPRESGSDQAWIDLSKNIGSGAASGVIRLWDRIVFAPEVAGLALVVVLSIVFMCHVLGESTRTLMALRTKDNPEAAGALTARRRQSSPLAIAMVCGIALMITFLFQARASLPGLAQARLNAAIAQRAAVETERDAIPADEQDGEKYIQLNQDLRKAKKVVADLQERTNYAIGIEKLNLPISLLNVVLALVATTGGYLFSRASITEEQPANPKAQSLASTLAGLLQRRNDQLARVRELDSALQANFAKIKYLGNSRPLRGWRSKEQRLESIIPLYRKENAKKRCLDVHSILSFRQERKLNLPQIEEDKTFGLPQDFEAHQAEFKRLRALILALQRRNPQPEAVERAA